MIIDVNSDYDIIKWKRNSEEWKIAPLEELIDCFDKYTWIPVSEMLPKEEEETYWVCTDAGTQFECRWTNVNHFWTDLTTNWHWHIMDIPKYTKVIAWMPLPEPYEEGDAE